MKKEYDDETEPTARIAAANAALKYYREASFQVRDGQVRFLYEPLISLHYEIATKIGNSLAKGNR